MSLASKIVSLSGDQNRGSQIGINSGQIFNIFSGHNPEEPKEIRREPFSNVPFNPDPDFISRGDVLDQLQEKLSSPFSRVALVGLGGVGKSQIAIQYSHQVREKHPQTWVFWIHASSTARFEEGYSNIAGTIGLSAEDGSQKRTHDKVKSWLCSNGPWLMVVDNADDISTFFPQHEQLGTVPRPTQAGPSLPLSNLLPQTSYGTILFTSRNEGLALRLTGKQDTIVRIGNMTETQGRELVEKKLGASHSDHVLQLLRTLDYIPLAITQALAYINRLGARGSIQKYLELFSKSGKIQTSLLMKHLDDMRRDHDAQNSIILTWQISFEHIRNQRQSAADLLSFMSFFNQQGIPDFVLRAYSAKQHGTDFDLEFEDDLIILQDYSLVSCETSGEAFEMHRLVQVCTQAWLETNQSLSLVRQEFLEVFAAEYPRDQYSHISRCQVLNPHVELASLSEPENNSSQNSWATLLELAGLYNAAVGNYRIAEDLARKSLALISRTKGSSHPRTVYHMSYLAAVLQEQGKLEETDLRTLQRFLEDTDPFDSYTAYTVINLAKVLRIQGGYHESEQLHRTALGILTTALGDRHINTMEAMLDLAWIIYRQGKFWEAEKLLQETLDLLKSTQGEQHPVVLICMRMLALAIHGKGEYEAAQSILQNTLQSQRQIIGQEHPETLASMTILAYTLVAQGKYADVELLLRDGLQIANVLFGDTNFRTHEIAILLALVLASQGNYVESNVLQTPVLHSLRTILGESHPNTMACMNYMAIILAYRGKHLEAENMFQQLFQLQQKLFGDKHPMTIESVANIAVVLHCQGKHQDAEKAYEMAHNELRTSLGPNHPNTIRCRMNQESPLQEGLTSNFDVPGLKFIL